MNFKGHAYRFADDDVEQTDEDSSRGKGRRKLSENERRLSEAVAVVAARNRAPYYDATVTVTRIQPWSLKNRPKDWKPRRAR